MWSTVTKIVSKHAPLLMVAITSAFLVATGLAYYHLTNLSQNLISTKTHAQEVEKKLTSSKNDYEKTLQELKNLQAQDQLQINKKLHAEIEAIQKTYTAAVKTYENLVKLKEANTKVPKLDDQFAKIITFLSEKKYASAEAELKNLDKAISDEQAKIASTFKIPENVVVNNAPPGSGYRRQKVDTPVGSYMVDIIAADLGSTRVIVDTASDGTCGNDCPVTSLAAYAGRSGAFAGINGPYFCPASYPSCAGKTNSFDTLLMNKNKVYFNSDNNIYSTVPAVIFSGSSARFVSQSSQWGRDTGVDSVIAAQPLLMLNGQRVFGGDGEVKRSGKGNRSFVGATGSTAYIGVVYSASTAEVAYVLETLGVANALNLDSGGSTALWSNGRYLTGPGRDTPFGILFVRK